MSTQVEVLILFMGNALPFRKLAHVAVLLLATWLTLRSTSAVDGSEFSGGTITGPILTMYYFAILAFVAGIILAYPFPRIASVISLLASVLTFPFFVYFIAPGPFRALFKGEYSVPLQSNFVWSRWSLEPVIAVLIVTTISVWNLLSVRRHKVERSAMP